MKKIVVETKMPLRRINRVIKGVCEQAFSSQIKRGQIYIYFSKHLTDEQLIKIAQMLSLEIISKSSARAVLRH